MHAEVIRACLHLMSPEVSMNHGDMKRERSISITLISETVAIQTRVIMIYYIMNLSYKNQTVYPRRIYSINYCKIQARAMGVCIVVFYYNILRAFILGSLY